MNLRLRSLALALLTTMTIVNVGGGGVVGGGDQPVSYEEELRRSRELAEQSRPRCYIEFDTFREAAQQCPDSAVMKVLFSDKWVCSCLEP